MTSVRIIVVSHEASSTVADISSVPSQPLSPIKLVQAAIWPTGHNIVAIGSLHSLSPLPSLLLAIATCFITRTYWPANFCCFMGRVAQKTHYMAKHGDHKLCYIIHLGAPALSDLIQVTIKLFYNFSLNGEKILYSLSHYVCGCNNGNILGEIQFKVCRNRSMSTVSKTIQCDQ